VFFGVFVILSPGYHQSLKSDTRAACSRRVSDTT
jgi:hypothetical protein